ncbi:MAG: NapC/NirT family cytochrome c [Gemmatimonadota bacterium]|nr:NapC/NirT family cytochrome c [Gemmatimonadota bacterium]MDP7032744.1 NapC/NirT family cytochrome c [Gemmatimonadota bacterium]
MRLLAGRFGIFSLRNANHPLGLLGLLVMYLSGLLLVILLSLDLLGFHTSPYLGIVTFLALPLFFVAGVVLVLVGRWRVRRRSGPGDRGPLHPFPQWDLNLPEHRQRFLVLAVGITMVFTLAATLSFRGVEFMESVTFCGRVCHAVMDPEYIAYSNSPHARVACVDCHIGPGANWFVKSKISGLRQVLAVATGDFSRPIPTPIHNLRPARETCEQCHWPEKFHGDKVLVKNHYEEDRENTESTNVLILKVGGGSVESGFAEGIHWHMNLENRIHYVADESHETVHWVRSENPDGIVREYFREGFDPPEGFPEGFEVRRMDCMDCHNRPTHTFELSADALDKAISSGAISRGLPYIKREGMRALEAGYETRDAAAAEIPAALDAFYAEHHPEWVDAAELRAAKTEIVGIYRKNVFPKMGLDWGTYPNHIGHANDGGCFRCHDEEHLTADGKSISQDCDTCHNLLAWEEEDPEILDQLF